ncbi:hypothetical protein [Photobacterium rosenbergii]|uniref:hypothetical protein n=1 Tax=Photobacterium rosenbergii TaxID=294936 RepID=UPI001304FCD9|nr:hypothetical protein [Photobacterium rosenbergii]
MIFWVHEASNDHILIRGPTHSKLPVESTHNDLGGKDALLTTAISMTVEKH